jgi:hypothetical protein
LWGGLSAALSNKGTPVKVTTIDEIIKELGLNGFDILKMDIEGEELNALSGDFLDNVRELMVECHDRTSSIIRSKLEAEGFLVSEWNFSSLKVLKRIIANFRSFVDAELKTYFVATILALKYVCRLSPHPVPAEQSSGIKLLYATRYRTSAMPKCLHP